MTNNRDEVRELIERTNLVLAQCRAEAFAIAVREREEKETQILSARYAREHPSRMGRIYDARSPEGRESVAHREVWEAQYRKEAAQRSAASRSRNNRDQGLSRER